MKISGRKLASMVANDGFPRTTKCDWDLKVMRADRGKYIGFVEMVARRKWQ